jgi:hypothetical protein
MTVALDDNRTRVLGALFAADRTSAILPANALRIGRLDDSNCTQ